MKIALILVYGSLLLLTASTHSTLQPHTRISEKVTLVSITELEILPPHEIRQRYPKGVQVFSDRLPALLDSKLQKLGLAGYPIHYIQPDRALLRKLTLQVVKSNGIKRFLNLAYNTAPSCPPYLKDEFLRFTTRNNDDVQPHSLNELTHYSGSDYRQVLGSQRLWQGFGFSSITSVPSEIKFWLDKVSQDSLHLTDKAFKNCQVRLNNEQLNEISRLIAVDYLSSVVRGLYYHRLGAPLTAYRLLAIQTTH